MVLFNLNYSQHTPQNWISIPLKNIIYFIFIQKYTIIIINIIIIEMISRGFSEKNNLSML